MDVDHHNMKIEFPEMRDAIGVLFEENPLFARLCSTYNDVTNTIEEIENKNVPVDDFSFESMKKHRVKLKDILYHLMLAYRSGQKSAR